MNEYIIQKWNSVVKKDDTVYHLGDVGTITYIIDEIENLYCMNNQRTLKKYR